MIFRTSCAFNVVPPVLILRKTSNFTISGHFASSILIASCVSSILDRYFQFHISHVSLASRADVMLVAPASANVIGKMAFGIADDMLTTTAMAMTCPVLISPAMNVNMFHNPILQDNLKRLESYGRIIIPPDNGYLACGVTGDGKMPSEEVLLDYILREIALAKG